MAREPLDLGRLSQFGPKGGAQDAGTGSRPDAGESATASAPDRASAVKPETDWERAAGLPSREPVDDTSLTIRLSRVQAYRFRQLAKADRYKLGAFLEILMDAHEGRSDP